MIAFHFFNGRNVFVSSLFISLLALASVSPKGAEATPDEDRETCKKNLSAIFAGIKAYRAEFKDLPPWLSDLVPKYIKDPNTLVCPVTRKTGEVNNYGLEDPNLSTAYTYEFADTIIPDVIFKSATHTMREWKRKQMALVGSKVPMVRCHHHGRVLNLSFDGQIYESEPSWEILFADVIDPADLSAGRVFAAETALSAATRARAEIPPRNPKTPANLIDLSRYYNAALTETWHRNSPSEPPANDLSWLPRGVNKFAEVEFDARGLIQLSGRQLKHPRFPASVKNIRVDRKAAKIHFLHGTGWNGPDGTPVATYVIHYGNGQTQNFKVLYGVHVVDWVTQGVDLKDQANSVIAWTGKSPATDSQTVLHIYKTQFVNPSPDQTITSIDYISGGEDPAPFLIAITVEEPR